MEKRKVFQSIKTFISSSINCIYYNSVLQEGKKIKNVYYLDININTDLQPSLY